MSRDWLNLILVRRAAERKRRQVYRSEMHGQLPFDVKGMDDAVPTIDFTPNRAADPPYSLERTDVDGAVLSFGSLVSARLIVPLWYFHRPTRRFGRPRNFYQIHQRCRCYRFHGGSSDVPRKTDRKDGRHRVGFRQDCRKITYAGSCYPSLSINQHLPCSVICLLARITPEAM